MKKCEKKDILLNFILDNLNHKYFLMSIFAGIFTGACIGFYFAEKDVPFPVRYHKRQDGKTGHLSIDLEIADVITRDVRQALGYGKQ